MDSYEQPTFYQVHILLAECIFSFIQQLMTTCFQTNIMGPTSLPYKSANSVSYNKVVTLTSFQGAETLVQRCLTRATPETLTREKVLLILC